MKQLKMSLIGAGLIAARRIEAARRLAGAGSKARASCNRDAARWRAACETNIPRFLTAKLRCNTLRAMRLRATPRRQPRRAGLAPFD